MIVLHGMILKVTENTMPVNNIMSYLEAQSLPVQLSCLPLVYGGRLYTCWHSSTSINISLCGLTSPSNSGSDCRESRLRRIRQTDGDAVGVDLSRGGSGAQGPE